MRDLLVTLCLLVAWKAGELAGRFAAPPTHVPTYLLEPGEVLEPGACVELRATSYDPPPVAPGTVDIEAMFALALLFRRSSFPEGQH